MRKLALSWLGVFLLFPSFALAAEAAPGPAGRLTVRSFQFKFKDAEKAAVLIKPLVSAEGSMSIQPSTNTLVVTDRPENVRSIANTISQFDAAPKNLRLQIRLVAASRVANPSKVPDDLKEVSAKLAGVLRFNTFENLGEIVAEGKEGDSAIAELSAGFRADFKFGDYDPISESVKLTDFRLGRVQAEGAGSQLVPILKTSLNLKSGQTVVLGASRLPQSNKALMLVLVVRPGK